MTRRIVSSSHKNSQPRFSFWWDTGRKLATVKVGIMEQKLLEEYCNLLVKVALERSPRLKMTQPLPSRKTPLKINICSHSYILHTWPLVAARARASRAPATVRVPDVRPAARLRLRCSSPPHSWEESPAGACVTLLGARPSTGLRPGVTGLMVEWQASAETAVEGKGAELTRPGAPTTFKSPLGGDWVPKS